MRRLLWIAIGLVLAAGLGAWVVTQRLNAPYRGFTDPEIFVEIESGLSVGAIADRLAAAGVVRDPLTFRIAARLAQADRHLQAGEYRFAEPASARDVATRLARGDVYTRGVTFPEGLTIHEMAPIFERSGLGTAAEFEAAARHVALVAEFDPTARTLEGYLFPSTYALSQRAGADGTVRAMVAQFGRAFDPALREQAAGRRLTPRQVVTIASLIEKETALPDERGLVSAVYHNRLKAGMLLQCDPTVIYALMLAGRWTGNLRKVDLQMDSPYNTYRYPGLPPGPIASPGRAAIHAAVWPADADYLYFVSRNDGSHVFASTLAEHNRNVEKYQKRH
jgi:UPF0755 protein